MCESRKNINFRSNTRYSYQRSMIKYLDHVFLHALWIMASQNRKQFIIRDKEEPWKGIPLRVQVIIQTLLTLFQTGD